MTKEVECYSLWLPMLCQKDAPRVQDVNGVPLDACRASEPVVDGRSTLAQDRGERLQRVLAVEL